MGSSPSKSSGCNPSLLSCSGGWNNQVLEGVSEGNGIEIDEESYMEQIRGQQDGIQPEKQTAELAVYSVPAAAVDQICGRESPALATPDQAASAAVMMGIRMLAAAIKSPPRFSLDEVHPLAPPYLGSETWVSCPVEAPLAVASPLAAASPLVTIANGFEDSPPLLALTHSVESKDTQPSLCSTLNTVQSESTDENNTPPPYDFLMTTIGENGHDIDVSFGPRRLFDGVASQVQDFQDVEEEQQKFAILKSSSSLSEQAMLLAARPCPYDVMFELQPISTSSPAPVTQSIESPMAGESVSERSEDTSLVIRSGVILKGALPTPSPSYRSGMTGTPTNRRQRRISTLPSFTQGQPIRLRVSELYTGSCDLETETENPLESSMETYDDHFSYDPYFSMGQYSITSMNGSPYGNGLFVEMGVQYMTLQDQAGNTLAVTRSRHTFIPSHVIYSPQKRYEGQRPSSHRVPNQQIDLGPSASKNGLELYPWALVKKEGRRMDHDVTVHFVDENAGQNAAFHKAPAFRSRHGFDGSDSHTHTVVSRVERVPPTSFSTSKEQPVEYREMPCCLIIRDPFNCDVFNVTIAPGIDPLLVICYLTVHAKMDVEPKLADM